MSDEPQQRILSNVARALYELGDIFDEASLNLGASDLSEVADAVENLRARVEERTMAFAG
jgi:hypothetical protein